MPLSLPSPLRQILPLIVAGLLLSHTSLSQAEPGEQPPEPDTTAALAQEDTSEASTTAEAPARPEPILLGITPQTLYAEAMAGQSQWLTTSLGQVLALYRPSENRTTKGALLLLHSAEDPLLWPSELENLRAQLPRYGWETLAIGLPQPTAAAIPAREFSSASSSASAIDESTIAENASEEDTTEANDTSSSENPSTGNSSSAATHTTEQNSSTASAAPVASREEHIKARLLAAIQFLNDKGQFNLTILVDNSSLYWTMQLLGPAMTASNNSDNKGPLQALIVVNLQAMEPLSISELEASFSQAKLPVLDVFFGQDSRSQELVRDRHRAVAMRQKLAHYTPLLLTPQSPQLTSDKQSFLLNRIRGFMEREAKGQEFNNAQVIRTP